MQIVFTQKLLLYIIIELTKYSLHYIVIIYSVNSILFECVFY